MPNHVTTRCTVTGNPEEIKSFMVTMFVTENNESGVPCTQFDFNKAIPMPKILRETISGSISEEGAQLLCIVETKGKFPHTLHDIRIERMAKSIEMPEASLYEIAVAYLEKNPDVRRAGERYLEAIALTGYKDWYDWSIAYWGTKWNSYDYRVESLKPFEFCFDTAWSFPVQVFERLAGMYPNVHFYCRCYDKFGNFAGRGYFNPPSHESYFKFTDASDELRDEVYYGRSQDSHQNSISEERKASLEDRMAAAKEKSMAINFWNKSEGKTTDVLER